MNHYFSCVWSRYLRWCTTLCTFPDDLNLQLSCVQRAQGASAHVVQACSLPVFILRLQIGLIVGRDAIKGSVEADLCVRRDSSLPIPEPRVGVQQPISETHVKGEVTSLPTNCYEMVAQPS